MLKESERTRHHALLNFTIGPVGLEEFGNSRNEVGAIMESEQNLVVQTTTPIPGETNTGTLRSILLKCKRSSLSLRIILCDMCYLRVSSINESNFCIFASLSLLQ